VNRRSALHTIALATLFAGPGAWAQEPYPTRPVTIICPFPPGGVVDIIARIVAEKMGAGMKATFVVEDKTGAGGTIGATAAARAAPDGYTLFMGGSATNVFAASLYKSLAYDPAKSFTPIGQISSSPLVVVVGSKTPAATVPELVALLKKEGEKANFASNGPGTFPQIAAELFKQANGLKTTHIPYNGGPAAVTALIQGDVTFSINHIAVVRGMVKSGKLKAIATTGSQRADAFADLPTLKELGMNLEAQTWFGLFAPAGTPKPIIDRLSAELANVLKDEAVRARLAQSGEEARFTPPATFTPYIESEIAKWSKVIREAKISID
jgi:tripartite-type tricarboxylate transporter receptor subunit TctC